MGEPPSPTAVAVVAADEQGDVSLDVDRWADLARLVLEDEGRHGELTLTFVDRDEIASLNREHLGKDGPTDVLSFPLDALEAAAEAPGGAGVPDPRFASEQRGPGASATLDVPVLLGDVVVCPAVAAEQAPSHAGTIDDELALLVVHGVLHVIGHDHDEPGETTKMRAREVEHLRRHHWHGAVPPGFRQEHDGDEGSR